ncbi:MAG: HupE/UreJ family protein [Bdellovibrionota bacterium]
MLKRALALSLLLAPGFAQAHPMDLGSLKVQVLQEGRLKLTLRLHELAAQNFTKQPKPDAAAIFNATLASGTPVLGGDTCHWRTPSVSRDKEYFDLSVVAVCLEARMQPFSLLYPLPFLSTAPPAFQLVARVEGYGGEPYTLVADGAKPGFTMGAGDRKSFFAFIRMGMGHIGAMPEEWRNLDGTFHLPEGLDHIFFVLALILGGGSFLGLIQCVSGFTLGHSLTLALATLKIIHIHSRWVEACIALSIAYVAGAALVRPKSAHRWVVAALFGTVHGLGFASALQELELSRSEVFPALRGFNVGVELGQCLIICAALPVLVLLRRASEGAFVWTHRTMALGLFIVGTYWFLQRAVN